MGYPLFPDDTQNKVYNRALILRERKGMTFEEMARKCLLYYEKNPSLHNLKQKVTFFTFYSLVRGYTQRSELRPLVMKVLKEEV